MLNIYQQALKMWGTQAQLLMFAEECAEAIKATMKLSRQAGPDDRRRKVENWIEEVVDVEIMLEQMREIIFSKEDCKAEYLRVKPEKLERLRLMVEGRDD
jgi:hypothetical protein